MIASYSEQYSYMHITERISRFFKLNMLVKLELSGWIDQILHLHCLLYTLSFFYLSMVSMQQVRAVQMNSLFVVDLWLHAKHP